LEFFIYMAASVVLIALCLLGMSVGLIFRNRAFSSCGRAARDFNGEPIRCAACGGADEPASACRRRRRTADVCDAGRD
jgi:hypothetical protein